VEKFRGDPTVGHTPKSGLEIKNRRLVPKRHTGKAHMREEMTAGTARRIIFPFYPA